MNDEQEVDVIDEEYLERLEAEFKLDCFGYHFYFTRDTLNQLN